MKRFSRRFDRDSRSTRRISPSFELLEGRALMALLASAAYYPNGGEVMDVVYPNSTLYEYEFGTTSLYLGNNVISASVAVDNSGNQIQDIVYTNGQLYQYDSAGTHYLGYNVVGASVAVTTSGSLVQDVVYNNGQLYQYDSAGAHYLGYNVVSASVALDNLYGSGETLAVVYNNGSLYEYNSTGAHYLGNNVVSDGIAEDDYRIGTANYQSLTSDVVFSTGVMYQDDQSGTHFLGQLFTPPPPPPPPATTDAVVEVVNNSTHTITFGLRWTPTSNLTTITETPGQDQIFSIAYSSSYTPQVLFNPSISGSQVALNLGQGYNEWTGSGSPPASAAMVYEFQNSSTGVVLNYESSSTGGLASAYKGVLFDYAADTNGHVAYPQPLGGNNIYLGSIRSYSDSEGHNVAGILTINMWGSDVINVNFVGNYDLDGTTPELSIENVSPGDAVLFGFDFQINSDGSLYVEHDTDAKYTLSGGFHVYDNNNGLYDDGAHGSQYYVSMIPNPNGTL